MAIFFKIKNVKVCEVYLDDAAFCHFDDPCKVKIVGILGGGEVGRRWLQSPDDLSLEIESKIETFRMPFPLSI